MNNDRLLTLMLFATCLVLAGCSMHPQVIGPSQALRASEPIQNHDDSTTRLVMLCAFSSDSLGTVPVSMSDRKTDLAKPPRILLGSGDSVGRSLFARRPALIDTQSPRVLFVNKSD